MDNKLIFIGKAAEMLGVNVMTLRRWDKSGKLSSQRTPTGRRVYSLTQLEELSGQSALRFATRWVSNNSEANPPVNFYCPNGTVFQTRLIELENELSKIKSFAEKYSLIVAAAGEIGNNSFDHNLGNWPDVPGIVFAYDLTKREIILADRGQGILKTLQRVRPSISDDMEALRVAFTEIISGRAPEERGNGLKFVRKAIAMINASLMFQTGNAILRIDKKSNDFKIEMAKNKIHGCLAIIKF